MIRRRVGKVALVLAAAAVAVSGCSERQGLIGDSITRVELEAGADLSAGQKHDRKTRRYRVTIENLTSSQPFSPGAMVTHRESFRWFTIGKRASEGIRLIAENGDPSGAVAELTGRRGVHQVATVAQPTGCKNCPGPFSGSQTIEIEASKKATRLSLAVMLICTNDGFTGLHGARLPKGSKPVTYYTRAYDAGTEANDELRTSIVDPCGAIGPVPQAADGSNNRTATQEAIGLHPGILGVGDLDPSTHGWKNPVAKITIERLGKGGEGDGDEDGDDKDLVDARRQEASKRMGDRTDF